MKDPETGRMLCTGGQDMIAVTFWHDASRNLDPHAVIANMGGGGMANGAPWPMRSSTAPRG